MSLVSQKLEPRLSGILPNNFNLTSASTATNKDEKIDGPIHYDNIVSKSDQNDKYGL